MEKKEPKVYIEEQVPLVLMVSYYWRDPVKGDLKLSDLQKYLFLVQQVQSTVFNMILTMKLFQAETNFKVSALLEYAIKVMDLLLSLKKICLQTSSRSQTLPLPQTFITPSTQTFHRYHLPSFPLLI